MSGPVDVLYPCSSLAGGYYDDAVWVGSFGNDVQMGLYAMEENPVIAEFKLYGLSASYHYADDTTREWCLADTQKKQALKVFDDHPELQAEMRVVAKEFLWSIEMERKST